MVNRDVSIVIRAVDKASAEIKKVGSGLSSFAEKNRRTFQKMGLIGGAAFAAIGAWVKSSVDLAAQAEGTWNKFNTVFGEGSEEMEEFVDTIRDRMPMARDDIARMAADTQDLLVPLGLSRDLAWDMTKGFLDVSNSIAAFNDVDPSEVLNAIKSWLTGSAEPLKRFWVDASVAALEAQALEMWLLGAGESFAKLDAETRNQIKAQALLQQVKENSSDAINGFEENADSLIFRQMELKASFKEISTTIGQAFLPIVDNIVKKVIPVVERIANWVSENQKLTQQIITVWGAVAWLTAVIWGLGLILPSLIGWFVAIKVAILAIASPITILVALLAWLAYYIVTNRTEIKEFWQWVWENIWDTVIKRIRIIAAVLTSGMSEVAIIIYNNRWQIWERLKNQFNTIVEWFKMMWRGIMTAVEFISDLLSGEFDIWGSLFDFVADKVYWLADTVFGYFSDKISNVLDSVRKAWDKITGLVGKAWTSIRDAGSRVVSSITWGRQFGWTMLAGKSYVVGERWPEVVTPASTQRVIPSMWWSGSININMWGVTVNNQADENRLVDKIKDALVQETKRFNYWIV